jgi:hypothetical protein
MFKETPQEHEYIKNAGFDIFFHEIHNEIILFFKYGYLTMAISLTSRQVDWINLLENWNAYFIGCPIEFINISRPFNK